MRGWSRKGYHCSHRTGTEKAEEVRDRWNRQWHLGYHGPTDKLASRTQLPLPTWIYPRTRSRGASTVCSVCRGGRRRSSSMSRPSGCARLVWTVFFVTHNTDLVGILQKTGVWSTPPDTHNTQRERGDEKRHRCTETHRSRPRTHGPDPDVKEVVQRTRRITRRR